MPLNKFSGSTYSLNSTWSSASSVHTVVNYVRRTDKKFVVNLGIILAFTIGIFCFMARIYSSNSSLQVDENQLAISEEQFKMLVDTDKEVETGNPRVLENSGDFIFTKKKNGQNCSSVYGRSRVSNLFSLTKVMQDSSCLNKDFKNLKGHGCWCSAKPLQGKPIDEVDSECRSFHLCERCVRKTYCQNSVDDFSFSYKWDGEGKFTCTDSDECSKNLCECALVFGNNLIEAQNHNFERADSFTCGAEFVDVSLADVMPRLKMAKHIDAPVRFVNLDDDMDEVQFHELKASVDFADDVNEVPIHELKASVSFADDIKLPKSKSQTKPKMTQKTREPQSQEEDHAPLEEEMEIFVEDVQIENKNLVLDTKTQTVVKKKDMCCKTDIGRWVDYNADDATCKNGILLDN